MPANGPQLSFTIQRNALGLTPEGVVVFAFVSSRMFAVDSRPPCRGLLAAAKSWLTGSPRSSVHVVTMTHVLPKTVSCILAAAAVLLALLPPEGVASSVGRTELASARRGSVSDLPALMVGSLAPALRVEKWLKGSPVTSFDSGRIYVVEFWATWCGPCIESMPHLSALQEKYTASHPGKVTFIGVSIREGGPKDDAYDAAVRTRVADFVKKHDASMRYAVAFDGEAKSMRTNWTDAAQVPGIPTAFVIDGEGRVAYIGHPASPAMQATIDALLDESFDIAAAAETYRTRLLERRDFETALALFVAGKPDDAVAALDALVARSPSWTRSVAIEKFRGLITAKSYEQAFALVPSLIDTHLVDDSQLLCAVATEILDLPAKDREPALELALRAARRAVDINTHNYPVPPSVLAAAYWARGDRDEAIRWQRKALELAPAEAKHNFAPKLAEYEAAK